MTDIDIEVTHAPERLRYEARVDGTVVGFAEYILATDLMQPHVTALKPDDLLDRALELFVENDLLALPVVASAENPVVIGMVRRADIAGAYLRHVQGSTRPASLEKTEIF